MKGFTLLFSIIAMSILLAISGAIVQMSSKQLKISNLGRNSQIAFYAADSGLECARYLDTKGAFDDIVDENSFVCGHQTVNISQLEPAFCPQAQQNAEGDELCDKFTFSFNLDNEGNPSSAEVSVYKNISTIVGQTTIQSKGYNTNDTNRNRRLERALELSYI